MLRKSFAVKMICAVDCFCAHYSCYRRDRLLIKSEPENRIGLSKVLECIGIWKKTVENPTENFRNGFTTKMNFLKIWYFFSVDLILQSCSFLQKIARSLWMCNFWFWLQKCRATRVFLENLNFVPNKLKLDEILMAVNFKPYDSMTLVNQLWQNSDRKFKFVTKISILKIVKFFYFLNILGFLKTSMIQLIPSRVYGYWDGIDTTHLIGIGEKALVVRHVARDFVVIFKPT